METKTIPELLDQIRECSLFIGNDSGSAHISDLMGKPTVIIYGPTNPSFTKPFFEHNTFILNEIKCSPNVGEKFCFTFAGIFCPSNECMATLEVEMVEKKILEFILSMKKKNIRVAGKNNTQVL